MIGNDRIRRLVDKLRAKADSTTFPAEREALLAKIAELHLRYDVKPASDVTVRRGGYTTIIFWSAVSNMPPSPNTTNIGWV